MEREEEAMADTTTISIAVSAHVADALPIDQAEREQILELGLKEWRVRRALEAYRTGGGTLAHAAAEEGISLREMIPLAFAHGLAPRIDERWFTEPLSPDSASLL